MLQALTVSLFQFLELKTKKMKTFNCLHCLLCLPCPPQRILLKLLIFQPFLCPILKYFLPTCAGGEEAEQVDRGASGEAMSRLASAQDW